MQPYAGFWWRVLAYFIDAIILNVATSTISGVFGLGIGLSLSAIETGQESIASAGMLIGIVVTFVLQWLYFALMESSPMQATLGKLVVGVAVTDLHGDRITFARATGRYFAKILSGIVLLIGYIMVAFTERKQGLHDVLAGTLVWKTRDPRSLVSHEEVFR
jgi:uncharacterized RDD family membrane protein YckC